MVVERFNFCKDSAKLVFTATSQHQGGHQKRGENCGFLVSILLMATRNPARKPVEGTVVEIPILYKVV